MHSVNAGIVTDEGDEAGQKASRRMPEAFGKPDPAVISAESAEAHAAAGENNPVGPPLATISTLDMEIPITGEARHLG